MEPEEREAYDRWKKLIRLAQEMERELSKVYEEGGQYVRRELGDPKAATTIGRMWRLLPYFAEAASEHID